MVEHLRNLPPPTLQPLAPVHLLLLQELPGVQDLHLRRGDICAVGRLGEDPGLGAGGLRDAPVARVTVLLDRTLLIAQGVAKTLRLETNSYPTFAVGEVGDERLGEDERLAVVVVEFPTADRAYDVAERDALRRTDARPVRRSEVV